MFKQKKNILCISIILIVCFLVGVFSLSFPAFAQENDRVIRVGFPIQQGITDTDDNGNLTGYTYEYLQAVAQYTGWRYEFVRMPGSLNETLLEFETMLEDGEIDLMGTAIYSEYMAEKFNFSGYNYGNVNTVLQVLVSGNAFKVDSRTPQKIRVAVIHPGKMRIAELEEYCSVNMLEPEIVYCDTIPEQVQLLKSGKADALLNTSFNYIEGVRTVASFATKPFYFISSKQNDIMQELNKAMLNIDSVDPYYISRLYEKYFLQTPSSINYSAEEIEYLEENPVVRVGALSNQPPIQYLDKNSNSFAGMASSTLEYISVSTDLTFEYSFYDSQQELSDALSNNKIDAMAAVSFGYNDAEDFNLSLTAPYLSLHNDFPAEEPPQHGTAEIISLQEASLTSNDGWQQFRLAVKRGSDPILLKILNGGIQAITEQQLQETILKAYISDQEAVEVSGISKYFKHILIGGIALVVLLAVGFLYLLTRQRKFSKRADFEQKKHFEFFCLTGNVMFEYNLLTHVLYLSPKNGGTEGNVRAFLDVPSPTSSVQINEFIEFILSAEDGIQDVRLLYDDGTYRPTKTIVKAIKNNDNDIVCIIGSINYLPAIEELTKDVSIGNQRDSLTHVHTIDAFRFKFNSSMENIQDDSIGTFILVDIDHFKNINDKLGYLQADEILRVIGDTLRATVMDEDAIVGRVSGDTFVLYKESITGLDRIPPLCSAIQQSLRRIRLDDKETISASIGAVVVRKGDSYSDIFQRADRMLYMAESKGRDCFEISYD